MLFGGSKKNVGFWKPTGHWINAGCRQMLSWSLLLSTKCCGFACQAWRLWDWKSASLRWCSKLSVTSAKCSVSKDKSPLATKLEHFIGWLCFDVKSFLTKQFSSKRNLRQILEGFGMQCMSVVLSLCDNWWKHCRECVPQAAGVLDSQSWQFSRNPCPPGAGLGPDYSVPLTRSLRLSMSYTSFHHRQFCRCQLIYHLFSLALMILLCLLHVFTSEAACFKCSKLLCVQVRAYLTTPPQPMNVSQHWVPKSPPFPIMEHFQVEGLERARCVPVISRN